MENRRIVRNRAGCLNCLQVIESKHCHDFVRCRCKKLAVDGGRDYLKRVGDIGNPLAYEELSEFEDDPEN